MSFPQTNTHRRSRRKLSRGQTPSNATVGVTVSSTGTTNFRITFARPVVVRGTIPTTVATRTLVSQTQTSPVIVDQVWSGNVTGLAYTLPSMTPNISGVQGGGNAGAAGTFP